MSAEHPRLVVLLCTHDGEAFLQQQLDSLAGQTLPPVRVVVHDWGSRDATRALLQRFRADQAARFAVDVFLHDDAPGPAPSFLRAVTQLLVEGDEFDLLLPCDQDDVWAADKLERLACAWSDDPTLDLLYSDVAQIDAAGRLLAARTLQPGGAFGRPMVIDDASTLFVNTVAGMSMAVTRRFLQQHAAAWAEPGWVMHDWALCLVAHLSGARTGFVARSLVAYRQHANNALGGPGRAAGPWLSIRHARQRVVAIHRQYLLCARLAARCGDMRLPARRPSRLQIAWTVARCPSLPRSTAVKVALGIACLWPRAARLAGQV